FRDDLTLAECIKLGKEALEAGQGGAIRENTLEVAVLDRARPGRRFRRFSAPDLRELLAKASLGS
ncbi:MAG: proteasome subunit alpha, partial [Candidatus Tectomicrobia bacterium]|nr:proteasome subunit alpha [Candidatus Tectomicrobia bacterium]